MTESQSLDSDLRAYGQTYPDELTIAHMFVDFLANGDDVFLRSRSDGHFTASCWLVSADGERVLLTHHRNTRNLRLVDNDVFVSAANDNLLSSDIHLLDAHLLHHRLHLLCVNAGHHVKLT